MEKKLRRTRDKKVFGVCGGIAEYFGLSKSLIRWITFLLAFFAGSGVIAYLILAILIPNED